MVSITVLSEDEKIIIEWFKLAINDSNYRDAYFIGRDSDKDYLIYKENNIWVLNYKEGNTRKVKPYTNIYNLCKDLLRLLNIPIPMGLKYKTNHYFRIPIGTKVVVMSYKNESCFGLDVIRQVGQIGEIIGCTYSSFCNLQQYDIVCDDGTRCGAFHQMINSGEKCSCNYIMTLEDFIERVSSLITPDTSDEKNKKLISALDKIVEYKDKYLSSGSDVNYKTSCQRQ